MIPCAGAPCAPSFVWAPRRSCRRRLDWTRGLFYLLYCVSRWWHCFDTISMSLESRQGFRSITLALLLKEKKKKKKKKHKNMNNHVNKSRHGSHENEIQEKYQQANKQTNKHTQSKHETIRTHLRPAPSMDVVTSAEPRAPAPAAAPPPPAKCSRSALRHTLLPTPAMP